MKDDLKLTYNATYPIFVGIYAVYFLFACPEAWIEESNSIVWQCVAFVIFVIGAATLTTVFFCAAFDCIKDKAKHNNLFPRYITITILIAAVLLSILFR